MSDTEGERSGRKTDDDLANRREACATAIEKPHKNADRSQRKDAKRDALCDSWETGCPQERHGRKNGARGKQEKRNGSSRPWIPTKLRGIQAKFLAGERVECLVLVAHELRSDPFRLIAVESFRTVNQP